jgi:predicted MFS family arabinose efflux permease
MAVAPVDVPFGPRMTASYLALFRQHPARRLLYALTAATLSFGMLSLTVLLTVERSTGSYRNGGFAVAMFALAAGISAPFRGRAVDRRGARRWLPGLAVGYAISLLVLAVAARSGGSAWSLILLAGLAGASCPPLFASARAVWPYAVEAELIRRGYALTALLADIGQVAGPVVASLLFLVSTTAGCVVCALTGIAGALLSLPARGAAGTPAEPAPMPSLLRSPALLGLLAVSVVFGAALGIVNVAVPAAAGRWGHAAVAGPLLAGFAAGSILGGLWFGSRSWRTSALDLYLRGALAAGLLLGPAVLAGSAAELAPVLFLAGLAFGPANVAMFESLDVLAPGSGAESLTWVTTAEAGGSAAGSALAGSLAAHAGVAVPFALASGSLVFASALALLVRRARRRVTSPRN